MAAVMSASLVAPRVAKLGARAGKTASLKATPVRVARAARASTVAGAAVDNETGL